MSDNDRAWRRAKRRWLGERKNCPLWSRWFHGLCRTFDRRVIFPQVRRTLIGMGWDNAQVDSGEVFIKTVHAYWRCPCADESAAINKDV